MHTIDCGNGWRVHFNSDWSGDVKVVPADPATEEVMSIPGYVFVAVAKLIATRAIEAVEDRL